MCVTDLTAGGPLECSFNNVSFTTNDPPTMAPTRPTAIPTVVPIPNVFTIQQTNVGAFSASLNGLYSNFPVSNLLIASYNINPCATFNATSPTIAVNSTISSLGTALIPAISVTGLTPSTLYCFVVSIQRSSEKNT